MGLRRAAVAGTWYPGDARAIAAEVEGYLGAVTPVTLPGPLVALISPHAGLRYSGPVAAFGYALLRGRAALTAVIVGPSHRVPFTGSAVFARGGFQTPLGTAPVDEEIAAALVKHGPGVAEMPEPHRDEHSLEMQLPFLQHLVPRLRVVPVLMGYQVREDVDRLAEALAAALAGRDDAILVASSDLSHYHPAPVANSLDARVVGEIERFDPESLMDLLEVADRHACGGGPMVAVMKAARARGADHSTVLHYGDSGDVAEGDKARVVGYVSAALTSSAGAKRPRDADAEERSAGPWLSPAARKRLLEVARSALGAELAGSFSDKGGYTEAELLRPGGAFVTVRRRRSGQLRACLGRTDASTPLIDNVIIVAVAAASGDRRFDPLTADELPLLTFEISVLGRMFEVVPEEVQVGVHGVLVRCGERQGLLLPQVAVEHGFTRDTFLEQACHKAGLPPNAWREAANLQIYAFTATVISEEY